MLDPRTRSVAPFFAACAKNTQMGNLLRYGTVPYGFLPVLDPDRRIGNFTSVATKTLFQSGLYALPNEFLECWN